jgi:hypothetical protein
MKRNQPVIRPHVVPSGQIEKEIKCAMHGLV